MSYLAERIQGPILYQTTDEFYEFSSTELNCLKRVKAFRPNVSLDEALQSETQVLQMSEMSNLAEYIQKHLDTYATEVLLTTNDIKFYVSQSWVAAYGPKVGQAPNMHFNSVLTGSLCISDEGTQISFADGRNDVFPGVDFPYTTIPFASSTFEKGKLSLWPSKVPYTVQPNNNSVAYKHTSDIDVLRLFFNVYFKGQLGYTGINAPYNVHARLDLN